MTQGVTMSELSKIEIVFDGDGKVAGVIVQHDALPVCRHLCGVDMAFGLTRYEPAAPLRGPVGDWLRTDGPEVVVGINVSGLLYGRPDEARRRYELRAFADRRSCQPVGSRTVVVDCPDLAIS